MMNIIWQSKSEALLKAFQRKDITSYMKGGLIYNYNAALSLSEIHNVIFDKHAIRHTNEVRLCYLLKALFKRTKGDLYIVDPYLVAWGKKNPNGKSIVVIHHINTVYKGKRLLHRMFINRLECNLPSYDFVVTVSKYWSEYVKNLGCNNVKIIYNSFNVAEYKIKRSDVDSFVKKYNIPSNKPIIYIGNTSKGKGVIETYNTLAGKGYIFITSGAKENSLPIPVLHFNLPRTDFIAMLNACDLVITMSMMIEGWNRTAHEAMLCKTPVIGSGSGGMRELLVGGRQLIANSFDELPRLVRVVLGNKASFAKSGYDFASRFDEEYFMREWCEVVSSLFI